MHSERWIVTYTKHMKQKRKVYHDGILELCGSSGRVLLYDDCEKLIDSRPLKKDEIVEPGATLSFGTHLVDIGNHVGNYKSSFKENIKSSEPASEIKKPKSLAHHKLPSLHCGKRNAIHTNQMKNHSNMLQKGSEAKRKFGQVGTASLDGRASANKTSIKEWNVLYTNQMTQKAKKYHDGILKVLLCGSQMNQIILLNEDGAMLSNKYMKSTERVETGNTCEFSNYLVEICEPRFSSVAEDGGSGNICSSSKDKGMKDSMKQVQLPKTGKNEKPATTDKVGSSSHVCSSSKYKSMNDSMEHVHLSKTEKVEKISTTTKDLQKNHSEKPSKFCSSKVDIGINSNTAVLRDASHILSILKKPSLEESFSTAVGHEPISHSSHSVQHDVLINSGDTGTSLQHELTSEASQAASMSAPAINIDDNCKRYALPSDCLSSGVVESTASAIESSHENINIEQTCSGDNSAVLGMPSKSISSDYSNQICAGSEVKRTEAVHPAISASTVDAISGVVEDPATGKSIDLTAVVDFPNFDLGF